MRGTIIIIRGVKIGRVVISFSMNKNNKNEGGVSLITIKMWGWSKRRGCIVNLGRLIEDVPLKAK